MLKLFAATSLLLSASASSSYKINQTGTLSIKNPSFLNIFPNEDGDTCLYITTFNVGDPGTVQSVCDFQSLEHIVPTVLANDLKWPNLISEAPAGAGLGDVVIVPDGFLIPVKGINQGDLWAYDKKTGVRTQLTETGSSHYFYHMVEWRDMNGDGRLDIITGRAKSTIFSHGGEMVWLEQPESNPLDGGWKMHEIVAGPDFLIAVQDNDDGTLNVYSAEFYKEQLVKYVIGTGADAGKVLSTTVVDSELGAGYGVWLEDLNADGVDDLMVANHIADAGGSLLAYDGANDFKKYTIGTGYTVTEPGNNQASPGFAKAFSPSTRYQGAPYILLAGDGAQKAYMYTPTSEDFVYEETLVGAYNGTIGLVAVGDVDGDGVAEAFFSNWDEGEVTAWTFSA